MANKAKKANWENHIRQEACLESGIIMIPKKPIREKSLKKQLKMANMMLKAGYKDPPKLIKRGRKAAKPA